MKSIAETQAEIVKEFDDFEDWQEKYEFIIELGYDLAPLDPAYKNEAHRIQGCQSAVWLHADYLPATHQMLYTADSDSMIVKGLISLLIQVLSLHHPQEIVSAELSFLGKIGLDKHLSSTRSSGLNAMIQEMKQQAALHLAESTP